MTKRKTEEPEVLATTATLPPGTKQVTRTTQEKFLEVAAAEDEPLTEGDETPEEEELDFSDAIDLDEDPALAKTNRFLRSLKEESGAAAIRIFAKRKPDPVGMTFRHPCNTEYTAGEVPFDENNLCIEALQLAIQKLYGGGRYQIVVHNNGDYAGAKTFNLLDPPERAEPKPAETQPPQPAIASAPPPVESPLSTLKDSLGLVRELHSIFSPSPSPAAVATAKPAETQTTGPVDPLTSARNAVELARELRDLAPAGEGGSTARDWLDGIADIGKSFGIGSALNNLLTYGLRAAERKRIEEEAAARGASPETPATEAEVVANAQAPQIQPPAETPTPTQAAESGPTLPGGWSYSMLPPQIRVELEGVLAVVVQGIYDSEDAEEHDIQAACEALAGFTDRYPVAVSFFSDVFKQSSVRIVLFLSEIRNEWAGLEDHPDAVGYINTLGNWWHDLEGDGHAESESEAKAGSDQAAEPKAAAAEESRTAETNAAPNHG